MNIRQPWIRKVLSSAKLMFCLAVMAQASVAQVTFNVSIQEMPGAQLVGLPPFSTFNDAIAGHLQAAGADWCQYLVGKSSIDVKVQLYPQANLPGDNTSLLMDVPSTFQNDSAIVGSSGGLNIVEFAPAYKIRTGLDLNPSNPDLILRIGEIYLKNTLYFDTDPHDRSGPVPYNKTEAFGRFVHELGHGLGFNGFNNDNGSFDSATKRSTFDQFISVAAGKYYFQGPLAVASYGGPIPLTLNNKGHLGNGTDPDPDAYLFSFAALEVMNGKTTYEGTRYRVSGLDVRILCDIGVPCKKGFLDVDGNGTTDAPTDGLLIIRYLFGLTGTSLTTGAVDGSTIRSDPTVIKTYLDGIRASLDIDDNGTADALTDGLLIIRYLSGLRGNSLISGAISPLGIRKTALDIEKYIEMMR